MLRNQRLGFISKAQSINEKQACQTGCAYLRRKTNDVNFCAFDGPVRATPLSWKNTLSQIPSAKLRSPFRGFRDFKLKRLVFFSFGGESL